MSITLQPEGDNVYRVEIRGTLRKSDLDQCQSLLAGEIARIGPVKLVVVLAEFEGWEPHPDWNDLTFYVKYGDSIERIAIVGHERWRDEALMFAAADLRRAQVEFFPEEGAANARAWLSVDRTESSARKHASRGKD
ncbi:MAG: STAS/SEC14 domain-containing protein [Vicinamibacterales bacterium]